MNAPCPGHERYQIAKPDTISDPITIRGDDYRDGDEIEVPVFPILDHSAEHHHTGCAMETGTCLRMK